MKNTIRILAEYANGKTREVAYVCETQKDLWGLFVVLRDEAKAAKEYLPLTKVEDPKGGR